MNKILLATDGSEFAEKALQKSIDLAKATNASVTVVSASPMIYPRISLEVTKDINEKMQEHTAAEVNKIADEALQKLKDQGVKADKKVVLDMVPADAICSTAKEGGYDLIVVGSRGRRGLSETFLGSVSNEVAHLACTTVMIVR